MALVLIGFMGAGKSTAARELAQALGGEPLDSDNAGRGAHRALRRRASSRRRARRRSGRSEEELVGELLSRGAARQVIALGGGSVLSERVRERSAVTRRSGSTSTPDDRLGPHRRAPGGRTAPAGPRPGARSSSSMRRAARCTRTSPTRSCPSCRSAARPTRCPRCARSRRRPQHAPAVGDARAPVTTRCCSAPGCWPAGRRAPRWRLDRSALARLLVSDENVAALYGDRLGELAQTITIARRRGHKTLACAERVWHALLAARDDAGRSSRGARGRGGGRSGRLLRGHLPAWGAGRAGTHHARRAGRLRLRRQDRRRPARGQELRRRLPPAGRRDRRPGHARQPARAPSSPPAGWRCSRPP